MEENQQQIHLMIIPYEAQGHMIPALMLAHRLVSLGFQVTYVCHEYRLELIQKHAKARSCNEDIKFQTTKGSLPPAFNREHVSSTGHDSLQFQAWSFTYHNEDAAEFKELVLALSSPPDCIITDTLLSYWAQDVADELRIPRLVFFPSPALALSFEFYVKSLESPHSRRWLLTKSAERFWKDFPSRWWIFTWKTL